MDRSTRLRAAPEMGYPLPAFVRKEDGEARVVVLDAPDSNGEVYAADPVRASVFALDLDEAEVDASDEQIADRLSRAMFGQPGAFLVGAIGEAGYVYLDEDVEAHDEDGVDPEMLGGFRVDGLRHCTTTAEALAACWPVWLERHRSGPETRPQVTDAMVRRSLHALNLADSGAYDALFNDGTASACRIMRAVLEAALEGAEVTE